MFSKQQIRHTIENIVRETGAELIDFKIFSSGGKSILRCIVDYPAGGITLRDCAAINKKVFSHLAEGNTLGDDYVVEINSPGLDRSLRNNKDFLRVKGKPISLWLNEPFLNKEYLEGEVEGVDEDKLLLRYKGEILSIDFKKVRLGKQRVVI